MEENMAEESRAYQTDHMSQEDPTQKISHIDLGIIIVPNLESRDVARLRSLTQ